MAILVATRNNDKFDVIKSMFTACVPDIHLVSLAETKLLGEVQERGSILDRAIAKANYFSEQITKQGIAASFDGVLGIDDGFRINNGIDDPDSETIAGAILAGAYPIGTSVTVVRAFALLKQHQDVRIAVTYIPFIFMGNPKNIRPKKKSYILSYVLAPAGSDRVNEELSREQRTAYNLKYSKKALIDLVS